MKIYLIRHGETTGDIEDRFGGDYDDHLTAKGIEQARELAKQLLNKEIEIIFVSPLMRAVETAEEVEKVLHVPVEVLEDLRERNNYGVLTGMTRAEAKENYPAEFEKIIKDQTYHDVAGSENYEEIKQRAIRIFDEISQKNYNTVAIISHGGIISTYVREVLTEGKNIKLGDCAILEIVKEGKEFALNCLSRTEIH